VQVVHAGDCLGRASQGRVFHWIGDALTTKPDLALVAEAFEKLGAGPGWHW
jgi:hypothetical protein